MHFTNSLLTVTGMYAIVKVQSSFDMVLLCGMSLHVHMSGWTLEPVDRAMYTFNQFRDLVLGLICTLIRESSVQSGEPSNEYFTLEETLDEVIANKKRINVCC